jgi:hypothetical protein
MASSNGRTWTVLGTLGSRRRSMVDQAGLIVPFGRCWSLDWWIGADDRWRLPSHEAALRQHLINGTPVVETAMRVPGGDAVHRIYGVRAAGSEDLLAVEIENRSRLPFAVALAIRPGRVERIDHDDRIVRVDGRAALVLPGPPRLTAAATGSGRDLAGMVQSGSASPGPLRSVRDPAGMAQAALLYPLAHGATLRLVIVDGPASTSVLRVPSALSVARGWQAQTHRGMRLDLPPGALADATCANLRFAYLFQDDVIALDRYGFHDDAARILVEQPLSGGTGLWTLAEHWRLTGDDDLVRAMAPAIARVTGEIERRSHKRRRTSDPELRGLIEPSYAANFWALRGLMDGALLLAAVGQDRAASATTDAAHLLKRDLDASLASVASRLGSVAIPTGPHRPLDAGCVESLVALAPLRLYGATDSAISATVQVASDRNHGGEAGAPLLPEHALLLASVDVERGDRRALAWLSRLLGCASPTWTWPPRDGDGHDQRTAGGFCSLVRDLMVRDVPGGLALCTVLPERWLGHNLEVTDAPTHAGVLSFAIRWHEDRPALLWELRKRRLGQPIRLTAPGLDPDWHSDEPAGDVLLGRH